MARTEMAKDLMDSTIRVIAREGLDRATTKAIATGAHANEVYIYRLFNDKEDMFKKTFSALDGELLRVVQSAVEEFSQADGSLYDRIQATITSIWRFLLGNSDKCFCFIQYYYSPYFSRYSINEHRERYAPVVAACTPFFCEGAKVWMLLNHVMNVLLDFATKVFHGEIDDDEDSRFHVFNVIYHSMLPYVRDEAKA